MTWSKLSRHDRGYGKEWDKLRKKILERDNYLCQCNQCKGGEIRTTPANEVDHIISKAKAKQLNWSASKTDHADNLQAINSDCHKRKSLEEEGKTFKPKVSIGLDGWPK